MKQSLIRNTGEMIKFYVKSWIKGLILAEAASEKFALKEKFRQAKIGAVKAYQAMAHIPIIGPALGAAAAAAAFAFLMAFHKGGIVGPWGERERIVRVQEGEYITRRSSVTPETLPVLQTINRTGQAPVEHRSSVNNYNFAFENHFNIDAPGGAIDGEELSEQLIDRIVPQLEDIFKRRRFTLSEST